MDNDIFSSHGLVIGGLTLSDTVLTTWGVMAVLVLGSWLATRRLSLTPGPVQTVVEGIIEAISNAIAGMQAQYANTLLPLIATLWIFLVAINLTGLIPGLHAPSEDLSFTSALAVIVFVSVHWYGIRISGLKAYLRHYLSPTPVMLPFHLLSEITRTLALALRLFGNMMSLSLAALLVLMVAGFLVPVPLLMLHLVEALVQAYIFGMLALIYIASGLQSKHLSGPDTEGESDD